MSIRSFLAFFTLLFFSGTFCFAADFSARSKWDFSFKSGLTAGKVVQEASTTSSEREFDYSGIPIAISLNQDLSNWFLLNEEIQVTVDLINSSISRIGVNTGLSFHVLGGASRLVRDYPDIIVVEKSAFNLSLLFRVGFNSYGASTTTSATRLDGIVFETAGGVATRFNVLADVSLGAELYRSLLSLAASSNRIHSSLWEGTLFLRGSF